MKADIGTSSKNIKSCIDQSWFSNLEDSNGKHYIVKIQNLSPLSVIYVGYMEQASIENGIKIIPGVTEEFKVGKLKHLNIISNNPSNDVRILVS